MNRNLLYFVFGFMVALSAVSCSEDIDPSSLYTFTGETIASQLALEPERFSSYITMLDKTHPSDKSPSSILSLLSARGHYTCFVPTNKAMQTYLDSLYLIGIINSADADCVPDSVARQVVFNSIIDHSGDNPYATYDMQNGVLGKPCMSERFLSINFSNSQDGMKEIWVNSKSRIIEENIETQNGYIHVVDKVINPSSSTVGDLIGEADNTHIFTSLMKLTGFDKKVTPYKDETYDLREEAGAYTKGQSTDARWGYYPSHRYYGFTVFVEPDTIFEQNGITDAATLKEWLKDNGYYPDADYSDNYTNEENAVNQFVGYHILPEKLPWNKLVTYSNEKGFCNAKPNDGTGFSVNVWEYYETLAAHRRTMKITGTKDGKRINRHGEYNLTTYKEKSVDIPGVQINMANGKFDNNALNGYYYTLGSILVWSDKVANRVLNERMRYDIASLLPEMMNNNVRQNRSNNWYFVTDYFDNVLNMSKQTDFNYQPNISLLGEGGIWNNFQIDEFSIRGIYDFTIKLPPVPFTGTYEIRYGLSPNGNRGMAQIYMGKNPNNLPALGIPLDLRLLGSSPTIGWVSDEDLGSDEAIEEKDKQMRLNGYMKGPKYFYPALGTSGRDIRGCMRKIVFRGNLEAGETYYFRFKSVLESTQTQFFFDYLEFVPKTIYNSDKQEDKW